MDRKTHWESVYTTKPHTEVSWYREHLDNSLRMILQTEVERDAAIIDVGGGSSTLVDDLLDSSFIDVTVLDISGAALEASKGRLGEKSAQVNWIEADITTVNLPQDHFDVWHDRAVFHFLTDPEDRISRRLNARLRWEVTLLLRHSGSKARKSAAGLMWSGTAPNRCTMSSATNSAWWAA